MSDLELNAALERAEKAERREDQFRNWWTGVSKQLDDLKRQYAQETWDRAESCVTHGQRLKDLDAQVLNLQRLRRDTEEARVKLVVGLQVLQDVVRAHREGRTRANLTVDDLMKAVEGIVWRTLDQQPDAGKLPTNKAVQQSLFDDEKGAA